MHKLSSADGPATTLSQSAALTGRKLMGRWVYPLSGIVSIPALTWTVTYRAKTSGSAADVVAHGDIDILIRKSDNTIRVTLATNVANSPPLTLVNTWQTLTGTYAWAAYTVVDQTDYLEVAYYIEVTNPQNSKSVYLRIDDNALALDDQTKISNVMFAYPNQAPVASFIYSPAEPFAEETVAFNASASYDPDGNIVSYRWDFGDGNVTTVTAPSITHVYENCGNYTVTLTVTDNEGAASFTSKAITVINPALLRLWADVGSYVGSHPDTWIHESWVVSSDVPASGSVSFNLYIDAINSPRGAKPTYDVYLAVAVNDTAQVASITIGPTTITTFTPGEVTWPNVAGGGTLPPHGVYPTWYALAPFGNVSSNHGYYTYPGDPYGPYWAFRAYIPVTITTSTTMNAGFKVHFDAQGVLVRGSTKPGHRNSNPFSHDLTSEGSLYVLPTADLSITKSGLEYAHVGDGITYTFTVSNNGPDRAANVVVTDSLLGNIYGPKDLDAGASETFTVKYTVKVTDPDPLTNRATVSSDTPDPNTANNEASWTVDILHPAIDVEKSGPLYAHEGETITYTITVVNTGDCPLFGVSVTDTLLGTIYSDGLAVGEPKTFAKDYNVPTPSGDIANTVTASGSDALGRTVSDTASWTVDVLHPAIDVTKSGPNYAHEGDTITYTITVSNTGDCPLYSVSVTDSLLGSMYNDGLAYGETKTFTVSYTVPFSSGDIYNTVTASGSDILGLVVSDSASWFVKVQYQITVTASPAGALGGKFKVTYTSCGTTYTNVEKSTEWTEWVDKDSTVAVSSPQQYVPSEAGVGGVRYIFDSYSPSASVTMTQPRTITLVYKTQYYLTVKTEPAGLSPAPTPPSNWYDNSTNVTLTAPSESYLNGAKYNFTYWDVDGTKVTGNPITVHMNQPHTATAHYVGMPRPVGGFWEPTNVSTPSTGNTLLVAALLAIMAEIMGTMAQLRKRTKKKSV